MVVNKENLLSLISSGFAKYISKDKMYFVTRNGCVYSMYRNKGEPKQLADLVSKGGYLRVRIYIDGIIKRLFIHRVVANAFIINPHNYPQVNHINEIKTDNRVENLEWCTAKYNANYGTKNKRMSESLSKKVAQIDIYTNSVVKIWMSTIETRKAGFNQGSVAACARGELNKHKGYKWIYI